MALQASGAISLANIQTEFGGSNPISLSEYYKGGGIVTTNDTAPNVPASGAISIGNFYSAAKNVVGQVEYTTPGTYSWVCPAGVTSVCVVAVGPGGSGALDGPGYEGSGGGGLGYKNNIAVTPGNSYTVVVGTPRPNFGAGDSPSYFINTSTVRGGAGEVGDFGPVGAGGTYTGDGGGNGGSGGASSSGSSKGGGGGAGGYSNGTGSSWDGGGGRPGSNSTGTGGGGVGLLGQGTTPTPNTTGLGGSGGSNGSGANGGARGGGAGVAGTAGGGAVRIIWGAGRSFPSTNTGNL